MDKLEEIIKKYESNARPDCEIDTSDIPVLTEEQLALMKSAKRS